jgi:hypothetical protein
MQDMQITGEMIHSAFLTVNGEGKPWSEVNEALQDRYNRMAAIINERLAPAPQLAPMAQEMQASLPNLSDDEALELAWHAYRHW